MIDLRPYQDKGIREIREAWSRGARNVLYCLPTGGGKTVIFSRVLREHRGAGVAIAHRQELVGQIALSLARFGVKHAILGPRNVIKNALEMQRSEVGRAYYDPNAPMVVAGVDTLVKRGPQIKQWCDQVSLWVQDEGHHLLDDNKWGKAIKFFPNALGLSVSATPGRADGKGLGRGQDGVVDQMVIGPNMRELIDAGYLADYRIFAPPSDLDLSTVKVAAGGDFSGDDVRSAVRKSHIVGDVVGHYLRIAFGQLGITFASDVETAEQILAQYLASKIPARLVTAKTPDAERTQAIRDFREKKIWQLVNVDLFGEGFDVPAVQVVSMARPTNSYAVYAQQFGRALRPAEGKTHGIIIDHVGNVQRHGLPDGSRTWSLARRERSRKLDENVEPVRACTECFRVYERYRRCCPFCGSFPEPVGRSSPQQVDGNLYELDPAALASLRGEVARIDGNVIAPAGLTGAAAGALSNRWKERQQAQKDLRAAIAQWAGYRHAERLHDGEIMAKFFLKFGVDILTAQTLGRPEAEALTAQIWERMG